MRAGWVAILQVLVLSRKPGVTDSGGTRTHVYGYDNIYQITQVNYPAGFDYPSAGSGRALATDTTVNETCPERSERDAAGNRTSVIKPALSEAERGSGTCTYTVNALNQYTGSTPAPGRPATRTTIAAT